MARKKESIIPITLLGLGIFTSLVLITFFLTRTKSTSYVSFARDSEGRITEIVERSL
jgi:hypothetical protein